MKNKSCKNCRFANFEWSHIISGRVLNCTNNIHLDIPSDEWENTKCNFFINKETEQIVECSNIAKEQRHKSVADKMFEDIGYKISESLSNKNVITYVYKGNLIKMEHKIHFFLDKRSVASSFKCHKKNIYFTEIMNKQDLAERQKRKELGWNW